MNQPKVAIVGAGPAGLVAAKSLLEDGLSPVILEQSGQLGGQWCQGAAHSGIWPGMHTSSCQQIMSFSDFDYPPGTQMFPSHQEVLAYLKAYAEHFGLLPYIRFNTRVEDIRRGPQGQYWVATSSPTSESARELYTHVVVAPGRYNQPRYPATPGLDTFRGRVLHAFAYRGRRAFAGQRVLVVGNGVSGLEIASDLALNADTAVLSSCRKPRYITRKLLNGAPAEQAIDTRYVALLGQARPQEAAASLKQLVLNNFGAPTDFGGLRPADDIRDAGLASCQDYLDHLASGRIRAVPGVRIFTPKGAVLTDNEVLEVDSIILATGYDLYLPFLSGGLRQAVHADHEHLALHHFTFPPSLPNFAFLGLFCQMGGYFPAVELQARWVAACWSGNLNPPTTAEMQQGLAEFMRFRQTRRETTSPETIEMFSRDLGVAPSLDRYPSLARELLFGLLVPAQFRLEGHNSQPDARQRFEQASRYYAGGQPAPLNEEQINALARLSRALPQNHALKTLAKRLHHEVAV